MRIVVHTYVYYPEQFLINELTADLVSRGHEVFVYTGLPNYPRGLFFDGYSFLKGPFFQEQDGVKIIRYPIISRGKGFFRLAVNYLSHIFFGTLFLWRLPKADIHFIFATSPITTAIPAILRARFTGSRIALWLQDLWPDSVVAVGGVGARSLGYRLIGMIVRFIYRNIDVMLIQSPAFRENLREFGFGGVVIEVPNWAPKIPAASEARQPEWMQKFPKETFAVTFAGNIGHAQGIFTILEAAEILKKDKNIKFVLVGDGSAKVEAEKIVSEKKLDNVIFFGRRPLEDMPALFSSSDALLVTLADSDIFAKTIPSKMQAYMSSGKPIIGSLNGVGAQVISISGAGLAGPSEQAPTLADNILKLKQMSPSERETIGLRGLKYYENNFKAGKVISLIENALATCVYGPNDANDAPN